jgi:hypothetical protein
MSLRAACEGCTRFHSGVAWAKLDSKDLTEASGIAVSLLNPGVVWTHNDGSRSKLYAFNFEGALLAAWDMGKKVEDVEDIAIGPGPGQGIYLYAGDLGGSAENHGVRASVTVLRMPEPWVDPGWAGNPRSTDFAGVEKFTLEYPDGSYDAETLMIDAWTQDILIATKQEDTTRIYRANLSSATNQQTHVLEFVRSVPFSLASGGSISADGRQVLVRREDFAMIWNRCDDESIGDALGRSGMAVPVIGPPDEPNGEGIDFVGSGHGYVTVGEGENPSLYFFQAQCPAAPLFVRLFQDQTNFVSRLVGFSADALGTPAPRFSWNHDGLQIPGATNALLVVSNLTLSSAGVYQLIASNASGAISHSARLTVLPRPDLRITEVQSSEAPSPTLATSDWWELTSFESQPVDLSGYRFNDDSGDLNDAFMLEQRVLIHPGESIVWVDDLSADEFIAWWGAGNLPASVQIITYQGNGLGLSADGDRVRLWDNITSDAADVLTQVTFGVAESGASFNYDPVTRVFGGISQAGVNGVIRAASTVDWGSPGRVRQPASSPVLSARVVDEMLRLDFQAAAGHRYALETRGDFGVDAWAPTGDELLAVTNGPSFFTKPASSNIRFYRVRTQ